MLKIFFKHCSLGEWFEVEWMKMRIKWCKWGLGIMIWIYRGKERKENLKKTRACANEKQEKRNFQFLKVGLHNIRIKN